MLCRFVYECYVVYMYVVLIFVLCGARALCMYARTLYMYVFVCVSACMLGFDCYVRIHVLCVCKNFMLCRVCMCVMRVYVVMCNVFCVCTLCMRLCYVCFVLCTVIIIICTLWYVCILCTYVRTICYVWKFCM